MQGRDKFNLARENLARTKASTQDILGIESKPRVQSKWARHHQHLLKLREQLLAKKEALAQDVNADRESPLFGEHMADAATDSYDRDWALSMLSSGQSAFYEVEQALQRIRYGSYGICEFTGKPIEPDRLRSRFTTTGSWPFPGPAFPLPRNVSWKAKG